MASNDNEFLFRCSLCQNELGIESKSSPCLHSFCKTCLKEVVKKATNGTGHCPQCNENFEIKELTLSPILVSYLRPHQNKCDYCWDYKSESIATSWCEICDKLLCKKCNRIHKGILKEKHNSIELNVENRKSFPTDMCRKHKKIEDLYCELCKMCFCDTCYMEHQDSKPCPVGIKIDKDTSREQELKVSTLLEKIQNFHKLLREGKEASQEYSEKLVQRCNDITEELTKKKEKQEKKWQKFPPETESKLKKLEFWQLHLNHLQKEGTKLKDIVWGVDLVAKNFKLSSSEIDEFIGELGIEFQLPVDFSGFQREFIKSLHQEQWKVLTSKPNRYITSILVSDKDKHVFLADFSNCSIIELTESGKVVKESFLEYKGNKYSPKEMFFNSPEILGVNCVRGREEKLIFWKREKIKNPIDKKEGNSFSVCKIKGKILFCNYWKFKIDSYEDSGFKNFIDIDEPVEGFRPLIRTDPSTEDLWGAIENTRKLFRFDKNGQKIKTYETEEVIWDFFLNESGKIHFCNLEGIFEFFRDGTSKNLCRTQMNFPKIFTLGEKNFVCCKINEEYLVKIFSFPTEKHG